MPTKGIGKTTIKISFPVEKEIKEQIPICPGCNSPLAINEHKLDLAFQKYIYWPIAIFIVGLLLESFAIKLIAGLIFLAGILWAVKVIVTPEYKNWRYWKVYDGRL